MAEQHLRDIRRRSFQYSLRAIRLYQALQAARDGAGWIIAKQFLRTATSIGANVEEAQAGESRYWLPLLAEAAIVPKRRLTPLMKETEELYAVITAIICAAKGGQKGKR